MPAAKTFETKAVEYNDIVTLIIYDVLCIAAFFNIYIPFKIIVIDLLLLSQHCHFTASVLITFLKNRMHTDRQTFSLPSSLLYISCYDTL